MNIPSWRVLLKLAFARIFCREYYDRHVHLDKSTCVQCGCKMLACLLILGASIITPSYTTLTRAQCATYPIYQYKYRWLNWDKFWPIIQHSDVHNINPALAFAIVDAESGGSERAISHTGARGAWQVQPEHHYTGAPQDLHHYYLNTTIATRYLQWCYRTAHPELLAVMVFTPFPRLIHFCHLAFMLKSYERGYYGHGFNVRYTARIEQNLRGTI